VVILHKDNPGNPVTLLNKAATLHNKAAIPLKDNPVILLKVNPVNLVILLNKVAILLNKAAILLNKVAILLKDNPDNLGITNTTLVSMLKRCKP
jgi:hypothetical protein